MSKLLSLARLQDQPGRCGPAATPRTSPGGGHPLEGAYGRRWRRSRRGGRAAAPGLVLEASEAQELADSGLLVLLQDQSRQR